MMRQPELREGVLEDFKLHLLTYKAELTKTCITCICFGEFERNDANEKHPAEWCKKYKERPPARVIAYGCNSYTHDDEIPF